MKKRKLPKFKSEEEEARFWDTHSPLDYPDEFTEVKEPLEFTKLETLAAKEKGKEKRVTKKLINKLKNPPNFARLVKKRARENKELPKRLSVHK
jgi:hypothetical protein